MSNMKFKGLLAGAGVALAVSVYAMPAAAATCDSSIALSVNDGGSPAANDGCEVGETNNDFVSPSLQVNTDSLFGFSDWIFAGKQLENEDGDIDIGFTLGNDSTVTSGTWTVVSDLFDNYANLMIVAKGGAGNTEPSNYVGYLFNSATSGDYASPFSNPNDKNDNNAKEISHLSAYVQGDGAGGGGVTPAPIPLPAGLPLILTGLGLFGALRLRKRKTA